MAFSDAAAVAQQLVDALAAARRMGFAPVVGLLTTDQVAALTSMPASGASTPARTAGRAPPNSREIFAALDVQAQAATKKPSPPPPPAFAGLVDFEDQGGAQGPT
eukprot:s4869_g5.t1